MSRGCVPLSDMHGAYPALAGAKSPSDVVAALERGAAKVKAQPFVDLYESDLYRKEHPNGDADVTEKERSVRKLFTKANAVMVTWTEGTVEDGLVFYTEGLCKALYGKAPATRTLHEES